MSVNVVRFGPGTLKLGTAPGTDFSCQVQSLGVNVDKNEGDPITVLCGDEVPGSIDYGFSLAGTLLQDNITGGISEYSWDHAGEQVPFEYAPTTALTGHSISGTIVIDPMSLGTSDGAVGDVLTSDVEWSCVGKPDVVWGTASGGAAALEAQSDEQREPVEA